MKTFLISIAALLLLVIGSLWAEDGYKIPAHLNSIVDLSSDCDVSRSMVVENPNGNLTGLSFILGEKAFTKIFSSLSVSDVTNVWNDLRYFEHMTDIREINLYINSGGGDAFAGLALADHLMSAQRRGFKIIAHASGIIASAAVPIFAVCDERLAAPGTIFMVHEASLWKWPGQESRSDIRAQGELMELLRNRYLSILEDHSSMTKDEWGGMEKRTTWFSAEKAQGMGLVDSIE